MRSLASREKDKARQTEVYYERKARLSVFPCIACGEPDADLIDWHHVIPENKLFNLTKRVSEESWWNEVLKCVPVCALCHRKIHKNKLCLIPLR